MCGTHLLAAATGATLATGAALALATGAALTAAVPVAVMASVVAPVVFGVLFVVLGRGRAAGGGAGVGGHTLAILELQPTLACTGTEEVIVIVWLCTTHSHFPSVSVSSLLCSFRSSAIASCL